MKVVLGGYFSALIEHLRSEAGEYYVGCADVGGYYAPSVEFGTRVDFDTNCRKVVREDFARISYPSSEMTVTERSIEISGLRGSVEDCILPILKQTGFQPESLEVKNCDSTRPDVPWYQRTPENATRKYYEAREVEAVAAV